MPFGCEKRMAEGEEMSIAEVAQEILVTRALSSFKGFEVGVINRVPEGVQSDGSKLCESLNEDAEEEDAELQNAEEDRDTFGSNFVQLIRLV
jgi:hypothetical protein